jgi:hypothetical protein
VNVALGILIPSERRALLGSQCEGRPEAEQCLALRTEVQGEMVEDPATQAIKAERTTLGHVGTLRTIEGAIV